MKKIFTFVAAALMAVSAFAIETEVLNVNYAQAAESLGYGVNSGNIVLLERNTTTKYNACGQNVYPFSISLNDSLVIAENDIMVSRGDGGLRYNSVRNIGFYDGNKLNYYGIKNVQAGDVVEIAYNGGGDNSGMKVIPALTVDNAVLDEAVDSFAFAFSYGGKNRTLTYVVRQFTVSADGIAGFYMQGAYIAYIKVTRDLEESNFTLDTLAAYNQGVLKGNFAATAADLAYTSGKDNKNSTTCTAITFANSMVSGGNYVNYVDITPAEAFTDGFKAGDIIYVQPFTSMSTVQFTNSDNSNKYANIVLRQITGETISAEINLTGSAVGALTVTDGHEETGDPKVFDYTLTEDCETLRIGRQGNARISILSFYVIRRTLVDPGTTTAIENTTNVVKNGIMYNILGQQVDENYKGIVIIDGKKILRQ